MKEAGRENGIVNVNETGAGMEKGKETGTEIGTEIEKENETENETESGTDPTDVSESVQQ